MAASKAFKFGAAFAAFGMAISSTAHAAPGPLGSLDPLVSLSVFGTSSSRAAVCAAGTAAAGAAATAAATAAQPGARPGCVLPILDQAAPPPMVNAPGVALAPVAVRGPGLGGLIPLLALAGLGALAFLLLDDDDDDDNDNPISPF